MLDNHVYNLMAQLTEEHRSLWRIKQMYKKDAGDCGECNALWDKLEEDKENIISDLTEMIKSHM